MWKQYAPLIAESIEDLHKLERRYRNQSVHPRVQMLRLLKSGCCRSLSQVALSLSYSGKQVERWWKSYQQTGITKLLEGTPVSGGRPTRISAEAWSGLHQQMLQGQIGRLEDAQRYLMQKWQTDYSIGGLSDLFKRRKVKLKTGRRRHRQASEEEQTTSKK